MKGNYLFPNKCKSIGWLILIPSAILGMVSLYYSDIDFGANFFTFNVPAMLTENLFNDRPLFGMIKNNLIDEISGVLVIISSILVAFSKEKSEDEFISKIRLESLVWAVYFNYAILLFSFLFMYDFSFFYVMVYNMFTVLIFFIIRFNWQTSKLQKSLGNEE